MLKCYQSFLICDIYLLLTAHFCAAFFFPGICHNCQHAFCVQSTNVAYFMCYCVEFDIDVWFYAHIIFILKLIIALQVDGSNYIHTCRASVLSYCLSCFIYIVHDCDNVVYWFWCLQRSIWLSYTFLKL